MPARSRKVVVLGYRCVGKTSLVVRHITGEFTDAYSPTIEDSYSTTLVVDRTHEYHLQVVDTSGQDELSLLPSSYVFNVDAYILVYSVMSLASFHVIQTIYQRLVSAAGLLTGRFPLVLVANKTDAADGVDTQREVSTDAGRSLAACWHAAYVETSASRGVNISRVFDLLGQRLKDADDGQFLMSTTGFNQRKKRWWRRFTCTASDTMS